MITVSNYNEKKSQIDWEKMPKQIADNRDEVEAIMEFYNDDKDIKEAVDLFLEKVNKHSVLIAQQDQYEDEKNIKVKNGIEDNKNLIAYTKFKGDKKFGAMDMSNGSQVGNLIYATLIPMSNKQKAIDLLNKTKDAGEIQEFELRIAGTNNAIYSSLTEKKPAPKKEKTFVVYWEGYFITRKSLTSGFSKTENENFAYTWKESEKADAEKVAKQFDGLVVTMDEALKMQKLKEQSKENREKKFPAPKKETLQDAFLDAPMVRKLMPKFQQMAVLQNDESEEVQFFIDKVKELEAIFVDAKKIDQKTPLMDKIVKLHYFYGSTDWFIFDYDEEDNVFFGYVVLNGDTEMSEAGYISVDELQTIKGLELDFYFDQQPLGKILHSRYPDDFPVYTQVKETKKTASGTAKSTKPKTKPKAVIQKTFVDNFSTEFQLIRRFHNIIKDENEEIPFRKTQLLFMAFNKAAIERKVRKTSDVADIFNQCNEKMRVLFEEFAAPTQAPIKIQFSDKKLLKEIQNYVTDVAINPAVQVLKRFVTIQNTFPEIAKAETLKKAIVKVIDTDKNNRLTNELKDAVKWIDDYVKNPKYPVETNVYGLSVPRNVCTNRIKCTGIDKSGKLHKGYKFEEHTGNIIKVKKQGTRKSTAKKKMTAGSLNYSIDTSKVEKIVIPVNIVPAQQMLNAPAQQQYVNVPQEPIEEAINKVETPVQNIAPAQPTGAVKNKLMDMTFDSLEMDEGWEEFMQTPAKNLKIGISGKPKNGKTAGSLQLANYLTKFGKVLYNFVDQGFNKSTKDLWIMSGLSTNENAVPTDIRTLDELEKEIKTGKYSFVFIDMINDYIDMEKITPQEFKDRFIIPYQNVGYILVFEVTKSGDFKGDQKWMHIVDAIAEVENFCMEIRGRYGMGHHVIWEEGLKQYNPKKYEELYGAIAPAIVENKTEVI